MIKKKTVIIICICVVLIILGLLISLVFICKTNKLLENNKPVEDEIPVEDEMPVDDLSEMTWTEAFKELNKIMNKKYGFTEWKNIQWQELYNKYIQEIEEAQEKNSFEDYYLTMLSYISEIPDGHVLISHDAQIDNKYIGGFFGFNVMQLDNNKVIITWIDPDAPIKDEEIKIGDEITKWNGYPINNVIDSISTIFSGTSATTEILKQKKLTYLVRAPINTEVNITLSDSRSITLKAYDDQKKSILNFYPYNVVSIDKIMGIMSMLNGGPNLDSGPEGVVETKMLEGNNLYVKLWGFFDFDTDNSGTPKSTVELIRKAVIYANENNCNGMVLDLRSNIGGLDEMVTEILGFFYSDNTFYEYQKYTNRSDMPELYIEPKKEQFKGKIITLINSQCISCGEGLALGINNLDNGETLGFYGTNGSFGMAGAIVVMPGEIVIQYPYGQSLDKNEIVQIDSRNGIGGVNPSIRIPMNEENALRMANEEDVELEEALQILREK